MKKLYTAQSKIHGKGIHTAESIHKFEHVAFIQGTLKKHSSKSKHDADKIPMWYGITEHTWIDPAGTIWSYLNHSCEPNCAIIGTKKLVARKKITPGTELTIDYSMTDGDVFWEMPCRCGAKTCRKKIVSIQKIPTSTFDAHMPLIPRYFQKLRQKFKTSAKIT